MAFDTGTDGIPLAIAISVMPFVASLLALASTTGIGPVAFWLPGPRTQKPEIAAPTVTLTPKQLETRFGLTARESEVALMLAHGRNSSYIATELGISDNTVRNYSRSIYSKMGVHTKQELIDVFDLLLSGTAV